MTKTITQMTSVVLALVLACAVVACFAGCKKQEEPSYQAVYVGAALENNDIYVVQYTEGEQTSGLIALHLPEGKYDVDPTTLVQGDILNVYGSDAIAMSYPGQAGCTNIELANHIDGEALDPFLTEWNTFAEQLSSSGNTGETDDAASDK